MRASRSNAAYLLMIPAAGLVCVVASGALHGVQTGRWTSPELLSRSAARVNAVPDGVNVDGWRKERLEISDRELTLAEATAGVAVRYRTADATAGPSTIDVTLLCGPHGPIALHPPTVCFRGAGYEQRSDVRRVAVKDDQGQVIGSFWSTEFERAVDGVPERIRAWWGWSAGGPWEAPESARLAYAGVPVLHKLYIVERNVRNDSESAADDQSATVSFSQRLLPVLRTALFPETAPVTAGTRQ